MTREESKSCIGTIEMLQRLAYNIHGVMDVIDADNCKKIIKMLEQDPNYNSIKTELEPCEDCISREDAINQFMEWYSDLLETQKEEVNFKDVLKDLPSVTPQPKMGQCKDCKYFEYDSVAKVNGIPLIVAHEICKRWGDGCKTREDGYCFLFEPQEGSDKG